MWAKKICELWYLPSGKIPGVLSLFCPVDSAIQFYVTCKMQQETKVEHDTWKMMNDLIHRDPE